MNQVRLNLSLANGLLQKAGTKDLEQDAVSFFVNAKDGTGKTVNQLTDGFLFNRLGLLAFDFSHFFGDWRFQMRREII